MKSDKKILVAFFLNLFFSVVELIGGIFTGSVAIISDSVHDFGDCLSIGTSYILERVSKKKPDATHTYGYIRYSLLGSVITTVILLIGSFVVIVNAIKRIMNPVPINYDGVVILAVFGVVVNFVAAYFTHGGESLNQKAISLHMFEDVLSWVVVLIGAVIMKFTDISLIDPILSLAFAVLIFLTAVGNLKKVMDIFLEKTPCNFNVAELRGHLLEIDSVEDVHHIHIRTIDGNVNCATLHVVTSGDAVAVKRAVKEELEEHGIAHTTVEIETPEEVCDEVICNTHELAEEAEHEHGHHHHHH